MDIKQIVRLRERLAVLLVLLCGWSGVCQAADTPSRPKVGVVLSGGGAKGVAHISALRVIEEVGIPVDYVVGTSMGSIIGGLYAIGYSPAQLDSLVRAQDWEWLLSDKPKRAYRTLTEREHESRYILSIPLRKRTTLQKPESLAKGQNIGDLFAALTIGYHDSIPFSRLPIPFACIATDITDGHEVVLDSGVLAEAMRASMAIPGVFSPVRKDGMVLVDGGLINNYPVDVARRMGADIIIGVDVQEGLQKADKLNALPEILTQIVDIVCTNKHEANKKLTDVYIKVNVKGYSAASFTPVAIDTLLHRGAEAARHNLPQLLALRRQLGGDAQGVSVQRSFYPDGSLYVSGISFEGILPKDKQWTLRKCRLEEESYVSQGQIEQALSILRNELNYSEASFRLYTEGEGYRLVFRLAEKNVTALNLSARFDTEEVASLLLGSSIYLSGKMPSTLAVTGRLGKQYMAEVNYSLHPSPMRDINLNYTYRYHDIDFYRQGDKWSNTSYNHHTFEFSYSSMWLRNFRYRLGIAYELYHNAEQLYREGSPHNARCLTDNVFSYFVHLDYNTQDRSLFPTRGLRFSLSGAAYTDNMVQYRDGTPFYAIAGNFSAAWSPTRRFTVLPSVYVRVLDGDDIPQVYRNAIGGEIPSRYLAQQIPFMGVGHMEFVKDAFVAGGVQLRYRMGRRHYLSATGSMASNTDRLSDFCQDKVLYGIGAGYAFDSRFGPLSLTAGYSNLTDEFYCFANIGYYF